MTFQQFIDKCTQVIGEGKLYFEHHYSRDETGFEAVNNYKAQIRGTKLKIYIVPDEKINQFYNNDDFVNCKSLDEVLQKLKEVFNDE